MEGNILIIEDDREVVETILLIFSYHWPEARVLYSFRGEYGIELARTEKLDAIILDLGLPDISGFDVMKKIREFSSVPIIVLTAHTAGDEIIKALTEEATDYVIKPFRHRELLARVQAHIQRQRTGSFSSAGQNGH
jgi:DNA-binding response OmpR family regulator